MNIADAIDCSFAFVFFEQQIILFIPGKLFDFRWGWNDHFPIPGIPFNKMIFPGKDRIGHHQVQRRGCCI